MRIHSTFLFLSAALLLFSACDTIPYNEAVENQQLPPDTTATVYTRRNVLIEDFTGHTCGNCPAAAREAKRIEEKYPGRVVVTGVHVGFFAFPKNYANGSFREDFRTPAGNALDDRYKVSTAGLPKGIVSRKKFSGTGVSVISKTEWESRVAQLLNEEPIGIDIKLDPSFTAGSRVVSVKADVLFQKPWSSKLKMAMYLTEDSVVNWQKEYDINYSPPEDQPGYVHRHVLRTDLSPAGGTDVLNTEAIGSGQTLTSTWNTVLGSKIREKYCSVVMLVYDAGSDEVMQVVERKLMVR
jgi:thiol-disulfide isomerase/thioredoxin